MSASQLARHPRLRWALTLRSAQGSSLNGIGLPRFDFAALLRNALARGFVSHHRRFSLFYSPFKRTRQPADSLAQLRAIWRAAGRPGQAKLRYAARRKGFDLSVKQAADFVRAQLVAQGFSGRFGL